MAFPSFFAAVPTIVMRDRLAEFLGSADGGLIEYGYADAVKLAGHSCPTVAGSYLLGCRELPRFTRQDRGQSVSTALQLGHVPPDPRLGPLLQGPAIRTSTPCSPRSGRIGCGESLSNTAPTRAWSGWRKNKAAESCRNRPPCAWAAATAGDPAPRHSGR